MEKAITLLKNQEPKQLDVNETYRIVYSLRDDLNILRQSGRDEELDKNLAEFVEAYISFEKGYMERMSDVYGAYLEFVGIEIDDIKDGLGLSRIRFTKFILRDYKDRVYESTQRVRGMEPARTFIGLRLKTLDERALGNAVTSKNNENPFCDDYESEAANG